MSDHPSQRTRNLAILLFLLLTLGLVPTLIAQTNPIPLPTAESGLTGDNNLLLTPVLSGTTVDPLPVLYREDFEPGNDFSAWIDNITPLLVTTGTNQSLHIQGNQTLLLHYGYVSDVKLQVQTLIKSGSAQLKIRESGAGAYVASFDLNGQVTLYRGDQPLTQTVVAPQLANRSAHLLGLVATGNTISVSVDGVELISVVDLQPLPYGVIGLGGNTPDADLMFDNLYLEGKTAPEPLNGIDLIAPLIQPQNKMKVIPLSEITGRALSGRVFYDLTNDIYVINADGTNKQKFIQSNASEYYPSLSPVNNLLAFTSSYDGSNQLWITGTSGVAVPRKVTTLSPDGPQSPSNWSPDASELVFVACQPNCTELVAVNINTLALRTISTSARSGGTWSGNRIAFRYFQNTSPIGVYLATIRFDGTNLQIRANTTTACVGGGFPPEWSPDGNQIVSEYCPNGNFNQICKVTLGSLVLSCPITTGFQPDWSPDGLNFVYSDALNNSVLKTVSVNGGSSSTLTSGRSPDWVSGSSVPSTPISIATQTPTRTPTPTSPTFTPTPSGGSTLSDFGIVTSGPWTTTELAAILSSVTTIGQAFSLQKGNGVAPNVIFKTVMDINGRGVITLVRVNTNTLPYCETNNNATPSRTITCGNLQTSAGPRPITQFVITHEMGHIFDNRSDQNGQHALREYIADTRTNNGVGQIEDISGGIIMGVTQSCVIGGPQWVRSERGWGSGPGSTYPSNNDPCDPQSQLFTDYQQNPAPYTPIPPQTTEGKANEETAADMFLNWVYRKVNGSNWGFRNLTWSPLAGSCLGSSGGGCNDPGSGNARFAWMDNSTDGVMKLIFAAHPW